jgi:hypothetical protein
VNENEKKTDMSIVQTKRKQTCQLYKPKENRHVNCTNQKKTDMSIVQTKRKQTCQLYKPKENFLEF